MSLSAVLMNTEDVRSTGVGFQVDVKHPTYVWKPNSGPIHKAIFALNCWVISPSSLTSKSF